MSETQELKGCAYCGGKALAWEGRPDAWSVGCRECETDLCAWFKTEAAAITAWNTRPREAELEAEVERLREALVRIANTGQSAEPDHWKFRVRARSAARQALSTIRAAGGGK